MTHFLSLVYMNIVIFSLFFSWWFYSFHCHKIYASNTLSVWMHFADKFITTILSKLHYCYAWKNNLVGSWIKILYYLVVLWSWNWNSQLCFSVLSLLFCLEFFHCSLVTVITLLYYHIVTNILLFYYYNYLDLCF